MVEYQEDLGVQVGDKLENPFQVERLLTMKERKEDRIEGIEEGGIQKTARKLAFSAVESFTKIGGLEEWIEVREIDRGKNERGAIGTVLIIITVDWRTS